MQTQKKTVQHHSCLNVQSISVTLAMIVLIIHSPGDSEVDIYRAQLFFSPDPVMSMCPYDYKHLQAYLDVKPLGGLQGEGLNASRPSL